MLLHPPVIALLFASTLQALVAVAVMPFSVAIVRHWDLRCATERQTRLEKRTYLVSTLVAFVLGLQALTLPVFVFTADRLASQLVGAMCAVGTLNANRFGFPALGAQLGVFFAAAGWLALHALDVRVPSYPLTRMKYLLALGLGPVIALTGWLEWRYFSLIDPDVLTSCCARVFAPGTASLSGDLAALPPRVALALSAGALGAAIGFSARVAWRGDHAWHAGLAGVSGVAAFPAAVAGVVSFVAPAVYDDVLHHCPFCLLKSEYGYQGYAIYVPLFLATAGSVGLLCSALASRLPDLRDALPGVRRSWAAVTLVGYAVVVVVAGIMVAMSHVTLFR